MSIYAVSSFSPLLNRLKTNLQWSKMVTFLELFGVIGVVSASYLLVIAKIRDIQGELNGSKRLSREKGILWLKQMKKSSDSYL
jgi:NhaP-type Na+/H+ or K+/H+ antiporter